MFFLNILLPVVCVDKGHQDNTKLMFIIKEVTSRMLGFPEVNMFTIQGTQAIRELPLLPVFMSNLFPLITNVWTLKIGAVLVNLVKPFYLTYNNLQFFVFL